MDLKGVCRTCLLPRESMLSIFSPIQLSNSSDSKLPIVEFLKSFAKISPDDDLPDHICCDCVDKIRWSYIFKLKLRKSEAIMKQVYVDEKKVIKSMSSSSEYEDYAEMHVDLIKIENTEDFEKSIDQFEQISLPDHSTTKAEIFIVQEVKQEPEIEINIEGEYETLCHAEETSRNECSTCLKLFSSKMALDEHIEIHTEEKEYQCEICPNKFHLKTNLAKHLEEDHGGETSKKKHLEPYKCELCLNKFRLKVHLMEHMRNDHNRGVPNDGKFECTICLKLFNTNCSVRVHMRKIHREKPFQCEVCPYKFLFRSNLWEHMRKDHACEPLILKSDGIGKIAKIKCKICSKLITKLNLKKHMRIMHAGEKLYQCEICLIEFQFMINLRDHMIKEHGARSSNNDIFKCSICPRLFTLKIGLIKHMEIHKQEKVKCTTCSKVFSAKSTLYQHIRIAHRGERAFQCKICSKKFQLKINLRKHLHKDHGMSKCTVCSKVFIDKNALIEHMRIHSGEEPFQCEVCPAKCRTEYVLKNQVKRKHDVNSEAGPPSSNNDVKFKCKICSKIFIYKYLLIEHMRIHSGEKPIQCKACPKKFRTKHFMKMHVTRMHNPKSEDISIDTEKKLFRCKICPSKFRYKNNLRGHMLKYHGPTSSKNKCPICSKLFVLETTLTKHMKGHTQEKFKCTICSKVFSAKNTMYRHIRIFHSEKSPFPCEICPKKFQFKTNLREHLSKDHGTSKCTICTKVFTYKYLLIDHMKIHLGDKPFQCEVCPKKFRKKNFLKTHVRRMHSVESKGYKILVESQ